MQDSKAIVVQNLHKDFGEVYAVRDVSFEAEQGEILSLLGPNGAGKSTTISMLACLLEPTQEQRIDEVLEVIGLVDRQKGRVSKFSGGMKRRLNIGIALLHRPEVIIMDEPTVGIDPQSRRSILDSVKEFNRQGMTVLYTTHYMEEAQELSDHIAIMDQGEVIAYGSHDELVEIVGELDRITLTLNVGLEPGGKAETLLEAWRAIEGVHRVAAGSEVREAPEAGEGTEGATDTEASGHDGDAPLPVGDITLLVEDSNLILPHVFEAAVAAGLRITSVEIQEPNLEAVFLHLTGRALRD
jgi:ABC-2 type transport system ATP-binding protein